MKTNIFDACYFSCQAKVPICYDSALRPITCQPGQGAPKFGLVLFSELFLYELLMFLVSHWSKLKEFTLTSNSPALDLCQTATQVQFLR